MSKPRKFTAEEIKIRRFESGRKYRATEKGRETARIKAAKWRELRPDRHLFWLAWSRAKGSGLPFNIEYSDIQIPDVCPILGIVLRRNKVNPGPSSPTLDKIIPNLGYVKGNVQVISRRANELKSNATLEEIQALYFWLQKEVTRIKNERS